MTTPRAPRPLRVAITGASGLIGSRLSDFLTGAGHHVLPFVRREPEPGTNEVFWDPATGEIDAAGLEGLDGVVHLAGKSIAAGRWTRATREAIRQSRIRGTSLLCKALAGLDERPEVLVSASAIGYYGDRGNELLDESSPPGSGFLAEVSQAWEAATSPAEEAGIRVVRLRIGVVLAVEGGALAAMLRPFRLGLGGPIGDGRQYMSWIALSDLVRAIEHLMRCDLSGPVNGTSPSPATNVEFARALGQVLGRPTVLRTPATMVKLALGDMGRQLLLSSARALPARLQASGFRYAHPDLEAALRHELGRPAD